MIRKHHFWHILITLLLFALTSIASSADTMPDLTNAVVNVKVSHDQTTGIYSYTYTIDITQTANVEIRAFMVDMDMPIFEPVKLESPNGWKVSKSPNGYIVWTSKVVENVLTTGSSYSGFVIHSKTPPGQRKYKLVPIIPEGPGTPFYGKDCAIEDCPYTRKYWKYGMTTGPVVQTENSR